MAQRAPRIGVKFWLNGNRSEDRALIDWIGTLKKARKFTQTLRDAFWLFYDLSQGHTDALQQLFPELYKKLTEPVRAPVLSDLDQSRGIASSVSEKALQAQLDRLEQLLLAGGHQPIDQSVQKRLSAPKTNAGGDGFDTDDLIEVKAPSKDKNNNSGFNLIIAATIQNVGHCNGLSPEIRAYGVSTKRIPKQALSSENWALASAGAAHTGKVNLAQTGSSKRADSDTSVAGTSGGPKQIALPKNFKSLSSDDDGDIAGLFD